MMKEFELFKLMYIILDALNDENNNDVLDTFLSELNPFVWKDTSGDPYYFNSFKEYLKKYGYGDFGYDAIQHFLKDEKYYKDINKIFNTITKEEYIDNVLEIIKDNPSEFIELR